MATRVIRKQVTGSQVSGSIIAPPSKSMMIRGVVAGLLAKGTSLLRNPSYCDDALAAMEVARGLGAAIETNREGVVIHGGSEIKKKSLNGFNISEMKSAIGLLANTTPAMNAPISYDKLKCAASCAIARHQPMVTTKIYSWIRSKLAIMRMTIYLWNVKANIDMPINATKRSASSFHGK